MSEALTLFEFDYWHVCIWNRDDNHSFRACFYFHMQGTNTSYFSEKRQSLLRAFVLAAVGEVISACWLWNWCVETELHCSHTQACSNRLTHICHNVNSEHGASGSCMVQEHVQTCIICCVHYCFDVILRFARATTLCNKKNHEIMYSCRCSSVERRQKRVVPHNQPNTKDKHKTIRLYLVAHGHIQRNHC